MQKLPIFLASNSPRRRELLANLGISFDVVVPDIDETPNPHEHAADYVCRMAQEKASAAWRRLPEIERQGRLLLAADTSVVIDDEVLGKPADGADAAQMLARYDGRTHEVMTAVAVTDGVTTRVENVVTTVWFRSLSPAEIATYVETGEPMDKAGAYGIQGRAAVFVERIDGSYTGVMGLPLFETARLLQQFGYPLW